MADGIKIEIKGIKELQNTFKLISKDIEDIAAQAIEEGGEVVKTASTSHVHVVTGWLRSHIGILHVTKSEGSVEVQVGVSLSEVPYAATEEFRTGGKYPGSHSYLRWALDNNKPQIEAKIRSGIESRLKRYR